ncbi:Lin1741 protein [Enterococcus phage VEsP-1]|uniref:Lin1741 protein n=1 Tax=Enterococcus phage VEsP-1 TaxID=2859528 RepID=A0AAE7WEB3_9CAUD|nr:Lin1741 protein [Enterococcus phage VEsP-1]
MNKQEVIKTIYGHLSETEDECSKGTFDQGYDQGCEFCIALIEQLDEPKKVILPKTADEFIKEGLAMGSDKVDIIGSAVSFSSAMPDDEFSMWFKTNGDLLIDALANGYEVEKEPLYYVKLPEIGYMRFGKKYFYSTDKEDAKRYTEKQIKAIDERYWPFAVKVEGE